jgi:hypothetical protein
MPLEEQLGRLAGEDEERGIGSTQDAAFFKQHPTRRYRMRLATPNEIEGMEIAGGEQHVRRDASFRWIAVKQIFPGFRIRIHFTAPLPPGPIAEIPEHVAQETFEWAALSMPEQMALMDELAAVSKRKGRS